VTNAPLDFAFVLGAEAEGPLRQEPEPDAPQHNNFRDAPVLGIMNEYSRPSVLAYGCSALGLNSSTTVWETTVAWSVLDSLAIL
jgi:hypothetical protein